MLGLPGAHSEEEDYSRNRKDNSGHAYNMIMRYWDEYRIIL